MKCPNCDNHCTIIKDSRPVNDDTQRNRRYECAVCDEGSNRFSTIEIYKGVRTADSELIEENRELKVLVNFLIRSIFSVSPTLDARVIREKVAFCSKEMQNRFKKYMNLKLERD